jgi:hypothetical protein
MQNGDRAHSCYTGSAFYDLKCIIFCHRHYLRGIWEKKSVCVCVYIYMTLIFWRIKDSYFHCFAMHFNSLCVMVSSLMMISWWSKHVGVILGILMCDIWINVLLYISALVGPLHIVKTAMFEDHISQVEWLWIIILYNVRYLHVTSPWPVQTINIIVSTKCKS